MFRRLEKIYAIVALLYFAGGLIPTDHAESDRLGQFELPHVIAELSIFLILVLLLIVHRKSILRSVQMAWPLMALCGLAIASVGWSSDPMFTLRRSIILLATTLFGIYLGSCFEWDEQLNMQGLMLAIAVVGSYLMVVILPKYGISHDVHWGDWKGVFPHKNILGRQMAFGILLLSIAKPRIVPRWAYIILLLAAISLLVLSNSATSLVVTALMLAMYPMLNMVFVRKNKTLPLWIALSPLFIVLVGLVLLNSSAFLSMLSRDSTLTGRIPLWSAAANSIAERPWLGYGYAAFWKRIIGNSAVVTLAVGWNAPHAHNGYLDMCLVVGLLGLGLFAWGSAVTLRRAVHLFQKGSVRAAKWPLIYLIFFAVYNLTESCIFRSNTFLWLPYVSTYISLALMEVDEPIEERNRAMIPEYSSGF
jgi:O-antigen ligase